MVLLEGMPAPDHATIARFVSLHLSACSKELLSNTTALLYELGEISGKTVFIDGTKIESCANKYTFVYGIGHRKSQLQKSIETLEGYIDKLKEYTKHLHICGDRNSYSKTDPDATFMRLKEDAMLNGQLKPAYNLQHGVDAQYITWLDLSSHPTDVLTLVPFLKDMETHLPFKYKEIVADAGYEQEKSGPVGRIFAD